MPSPHKIVHGSGLDDGRNSDASDPALMLGIRRTWTTVARTSGPHWSSSIPLDAVVDVRP